MISGDPAGLVAHETGHFVDFDCIPVRQSHLGTYGYSANRGEKFISAYEEDRKGLQKYIARLPSAEGQMFVRQFCGYGTPHGPHEVCADLWGNIACDVNGAWFEKMDHLWPRCALLVEQRHNELVDRHGQWMSLQGGGGAKYSGAGRLILPR